MTTFTLLSVGVDLKFLLRQKTAVKRFQFFQIIFDCVEKTIHKIIFKSQMPPLGRRSLFLENYTKYELEIRQRSYSRTLNVQHERILKNVIPPKERHDQNHVEFELYIWFFRRSVARMFAKSVMAATRRCNKNTNITSAKSRIIIKPY